MLLDEAGKLAVCIENREFFVQKFSEAIGYTENNKGFIDNSKLFGKSLIDLFPALKGSYRPVKIDEISSFKGYIDDIIMNPFYAIITDAECLLKNSADTNQFRGKFYLECFTVWI